MIPIKRYQSRWWSIDLPAGWTGKEDEECATFEGQRFPSALQISSARKESGNVMIAEIRDFANDRVGRLGRSFDFKSIKIGPFSGLYGEHITDKTFWREWWIAEKNVVIYITYNVEERLKDCEITIVDDIIASIKLSLALEHN